MYQEQVWLPTGTTYNLRPKQYNTVYMYLFQVMLTCTRSLLNPFKNTNIVVCLCEPGRFHTALHSHLYSVVGGCPPLPNKNVSVSFILCSWHVLYHEEFYEDEECGSVPVCTYMDDKMAWIFSWMECRQLPCHVLGTVEGLWILS